MTQNYQCELCFGRLIFVHGHYQCERCHWVGLTCCDGEQFCPTQQSTSKTSQQQ